MMIFVCYCKVNTPESLVIYYCPFALFSSTLLSGGRPHDNAGRKHFTEYHITTLFHALDNEDTRTSIAKLMTEFHDQLSTVNFFVT